MRCLANTKFTEPLKRNINLFLAAIKRPYVALTSTYNYLTDRPTYRLSNEPTKTMQHNPSWQSASSSAGHEIPNLWNPKVHYRFLQDVPHQTCKFHRPHPAIGTHEVAAKGTEMWPKTSDSTKYITDISLYGFRCSTICIQTVIMFFQVQQL